MHMETHDWPPKMQQTAIWETSCDVGGEDFTDNSVELSAQQQAPAVNIFPGKWFCDTVPSRRSAYQYSQTSPLCNVETFKIAKEYENLRGKGKMSSELLGTFHGLVWTLKGPQNL